MNKRELNITVDPDGSVKIDAVGFSGPECEKATEHLERALGKITKHERKREFWKRTLQKVLKHR